MALTARYVVKFRRRREGKTNYRKRLRLLLSGKLRFVVRKSNRYITCQFIQYSPNGDRTLVSAHSKELLQFGYLGHTGNLPAAYLTGLLSGLRAKQKGIGDAILDIGIYKSTRGSVLYASLKGALDAGIDIPHSPEILPSESRIRGEHIANYAKSLKELKRQEFNKMFSEYIKKGLDPVELPTHFEEVRRRILEGFKHGGK